MRFAIPVKKGRGVDSQVDTTLSECYRVLMVDIEDTTFDLSHVELNDAPGDCGGMVQRMIDANVDAVVFGHASPKQMATLSAHGIDVYVAAHGTAREALCSIFDGCLQGTGVGSLCPDEEP